MSPDSINNKPTNKEDEAVVVDADSEEVVAIEVDTVDEAEEVVDAVGIIRTTSQPRKASVTSLASEFVCIV